MNPYSLMLTLIALWCAVVIGYAIYRGWRIDYSQYTVGYNNVAFGNAVPSTPTPAPDGQ